MSVGIAGYVGGLIAIALVAYFASTASPEARSDGGRKILVYDKRVRLLGWTLLALVAPLIGFFIFSIPHVARNEALLLVCTSVVLLCLPVSLLLEFYGARIEFDATTVYLFSPWRRNREILWSDILGIEYSRSRRFYVIRTRSQGGIRPNSMLAGLNDFLAEVRRRTAAG
jgi:hypothetical protein